MPFRGAIHSTFRNTMRYAEVIEILVRYGFGSFVQETGLDRLMDKGRVLLGARPSEQAKRAPASVRIRMAVEELGPTFIKLGQILSTRPDLISANLATEFKNLQSDCEAVPFEEIRVRLEESFPQGLDKVFREIGAEPVATASLAQAHRAVLCDGTSVILKIMKPLVQETIRSDLAVFSEIARFIENHFRDLGYSPSDVAEELGKQLEKEMDLVHEGRSTDRLRGYFRDHPHIRFPKVYWEATTTNVLALEEIDGMLLSRLNPQSLSPEVRRRLVANGADAVLRMCLEFGFFHADPHPGNIFVQPDGTIYLIDCGMTGHVEARIQNSLADLISAVINSDLDKVIRNSLELTDADPSLESHRPLRADAWELISSLQVGKIEDMDIAALLEGILSMAQRYKVRCPADLVLLVKAITTVQSVALSVDPEFDFLTHIKPHLRRLLLRRYGVKALRSRLKGALAGYLDLAENLPDELRSFRTQLHRRDFSVRLEHNGLDNLTQTIDRTGKLVATSMILAAVIMGSSILVLADQGAREWGLLSQLGGGLMLGAGLIGLGILLYTLFRKRK